MRTDLRINYLELENTAENIIRYKNTLVNLNDAMSGLKQCLEEQSSDAFEKLVKEISDTQSKTETQIETLKRLSDIIPRYTYELRELADCEIEGNESRIDTWDIKHNLNQIRDTASTLDDFYRSPYDDYPHPYDGTEAGRAKQRKYERNYKKIDDFRINTLKPLNDRVQEKVKELFDIYTLKLEKYEETDDTYRTEIDGIYKEMTSMTDKIKNTAILLTEMHMSYYISLWETRMSMVMLIAFPEVIASYYINCACITCLPEEVCAKGPMKKIREYAEGKMEVPKEIWDVLVDRGPFGVIDYIGQGYADRVQTPQGAASVYGEVQALLEAFVIEKIHGPKIRSTIKTKIKSGINSKIKPKAEVGYGKTIEGGTDVWDMTEGGGIINGREYSQHAMERMAPDTPSVRAELSRRAEALAESKGLQVGTPEYYQFCQKYVDPRNIPPSVIEDAIRNTTAVPGHTAGTFVHQTADVTVIVNETGKVITVISK